MMTTIISVIAVLLALFGLVWLFVRPRYAVIPGFAALVCAYFCSDSAWSASNLIFWGIASLIVLGLSFLQSSSAPSRVPGNSYVAVGTIAGTVVGCACYPSSAAMIIGGAVGAFMALMAYMRTPMSPRCAPGSPAFMRMLAAAGLPAVVVCSMVAIVALTVF